MKVLFEAWKAMDWLFSFGIGGPKALSIASEAGVLNSPAPAPASTNTYLTWFFITIVIHNLLI